MSTQIIKFDLNNVALTSQSIFCLTKQGFKYSAELKDNKGKMSFGKLYGQLAFEYGITKGTLWDYLEALELAEKIKFPSLINTLRENETEITLKQLLSARIRKHQPNHIQ